MQGSMEDDDVTFKDLMTILLCVMVILVVAMIPYLNPPTQTGEVDAPGNLIVNITWPNEQNNDVDLWVHGPGEMKPVGYSNKGGLLFNLLRDDLGHQFDILQTNFENAYTRGIVPGEYTVNVHCYRCPILPVEVNYEIISKRNSPMTGKPMLQRIVTGTSTIHQRTEEITLARFILKPDGQIVGGSLHNVYRPLRSQVGK